MFISKLSPEQWAEARRLRAEGATYRAIGSQLGIARAAISRRAQREGWLTPARADRKKSARASPGPSSPGTVGIRSRLAERLYRVIECRIRLMELRMIKQLQAQESDPAAGVPPGKDERESFAALIDSINKVTEMASEPAPAANGRRRTATAAGGVNPAVNAELTALGDDIDPDGLAIASEKDDFRRELAEHLGKMFPKP